MHENFFFLSNNINDISSSLLLSMVTLSRISFEESRSSKALMLSVNKDGATHNNGEPAKGR
jgi:hypothetical protein